MHKVQSPDAIIEFYNDGGTTVTMYARPAIEPNGIVERARIESEWADARLEFSAAEFKGAPNAAEFLKAKAAECALLVPKGKGLRFDYSDGLARIIEKAEKK